MVYPEQAPGAVIITQAGLSDLPRVREVALRTWPDTFRDILTKEQIAYMLDWMYSHAALEQQYREQGHVFLLAMDAVEGECVGYLSYETGYQGTPTTKIHKLYVLPNQQGRGIGRRLIEAVHPQAHRRGDHTLSLNVNRYNPAVQFYERLGFAITGQEDIDIGQGYLMQDYIMTCAVQST